MQLENIFIDNGREKKAKRDNFDLLNEVHLAEYKNVRRPLGRKSNQPIEPAHRFEVNLEADTSTKEKLVACSTMNLG
jgi:arginyl-tRNA---protein transferase